MGEYAVDQMMEDFKEMTGIEADRSDFEDTPRKQRTRFRCATCGRIFRVQHAVTDHIRDKHATLKGPTP